MKPPYETRVAGIRESFQLPANAHLLASLFYSVTVLFLFFPSTDWTRILACAVTFCLALWAQRRRPLILVLRGFSAADSDQFLVRAISEVADEGRCLWIRNHLIPTALGRLRPLTHQGRLHFWILSGAIAFGICLQEADPASKLVNIAFNITGARVALNMLSGAGPSSLVTFLVASCVAATSQLGVNQLQLATSTNRWVESAIIFGMLPFTALLWISMHAAWVRLRAKGSTRRKRAWISDADSLRAFSLELGRAHEGFPQFLAGGAFPSFLMNAPVLGSEVGATDELWRLAVKRAITSADVVLADVTDLLPGSGLEEEIQQVCMQKAPPLVLTCKLERVNGVAKHLAEITGQLFTPLFPWRIDRSSGKVQCSWNILRVAVQLAVKGEGDAVRNRPMQYG